MHQIDICKKVEIPLVLDFIKNYWSDKHVLLSHQTLLDWQYFNSQSGCYNFLIAKNTETNQLDGILGFINTAQFDCNLNDNGDYWGAIWKVNKNSSNASGIGHALFKKLLKLQNLKTFGALGISEDTIKYMRILGYPINKMNHYYILNITKKQFEIAQINNKNTPNSLCNSGYKLKRIDLSHYTNIKIAYYKPHKSIEYFTNRYQTHPVYHYQFIGAFNGEELKTIFVIRKIKINQSSCLRIVDVLGNLNEICNLHAEFQNLLQIENAEYIDCLNFGIDSIVFYNLGFSLLQSDENNIIPNYFEPFVKSNIPLYCVSKESYTNYVFFKGDADQDRPNMIHA